MRIDIGRISFSKIKSEYDDTWYDWLSSDISIPFLNNSQLKIRLDFDDAELDKYKSEIENTLVNTLLLNNSDQEKIKEHLFAYYKDFCIDCGETCFDEMPSLDDAKNIYDYIHISSLSITRSIITKEFYCQFSGGCDWEVEHGISISFKNGKTIARVGDYGHVSNADAYADILMDKYVYYGNNISTMQNLA